MSAVLLDRFISIKEGLEEHFNSVSSIKNSMPVKSEIVEFATSIAPV